MSVENYNVTFLFIDPDFAIIDWKIFLNRINLEKSRNLFILIILLVIDSE